MSYVSRTYVRYLCYILFMIEIEGLSLRVDASEAAHALTHLSRLSQSTPGDNGATLEMLSVLGDRHGETWQHLYGLTLGTDHTLPALILRIEEMNPLDFRSTLLGATAWSWLNVVGAETLEGAVRGDAKALRRLLENDRYYSGHAEGSLATVLNWTPEQTKERYLEALEAYELEFGGHLDDVRSDLASLEDLALRTIADLGATDGVAKLTGYRYVAEPEAQNVAVLLHGLDSSLCLAQHEGTRLIVHGAALQHATPGIVDIAQALADENRASLLRVIAQGPTELGPLLEEVALSRSTVHHHLSILRKAGLVEVEGNAGSYRYRLRPGAEMRWLEAWKRLIDDQKRGAT